MRRFPDPLVLSALHTTAEDEAARTDARILAIAMSVSFVDQEARYNLRDLYNPPPDRIPGPVALSHAPELPTVIEVEGERRTMISRLRRIRERTADPLVRNAAHRYLMLLEI
jgi:hypothetical protein